MLHNIFFKDTSTVIHGNHIKCEISNCQFKDININNSIPAIADSKYSIFTISNAEFNNLKYETIINIYIYIRLCIYLY